MVDEEGRREKGIALDNEERLRRRLGLEERFDLRLIYTMTRLRLT